MFAGTSSSNESQSVALYPCSSPPLVLDQDKRVEPPYSPLFRSAGFRVRTITRIILIFNMGSELHDDR